MQLNLPPETATKLAAMAAAAGFDDAEHYVLAYVSALVEQSAAEAAFAPLSPAELQESLAMCDRGMAEIEAGKGLSVEESLQYSLEELQRRRETK